jgi:16S rRNA (adenine1518-N6/adenine1519-N6)-dimethyltransferase
VIAVELDQRLASVAAEILKPYRNTTIVCGDILRLTPAILDLPADYLVVANIPYNITSPIFRHLLETEPKPRRIVLTVQAEVAERLCAVPPRMSILALSVQVYGSVRIVMRIPAAAFYPIPKVDSGVVCTDIHADPRIQRGLLPVFFTLIKAGFGQKRKTLRNSLSAGLHIDPVRAQALIMQAGIDPGLRAEALGFADWETLCRTPGLAEAAGLPRRRVGDLTRIS